MKRPCSRLEKVLFVDMLCFSLASGLLLFHFMVSRSGVLVAAAIVLLALAGASALYEHVAISRRKPAERPALRAFHGSHRLLFLAVAGCILLPSLASTCLTGAGIGALVAWLERSDVSKAAWLGFFTALLWCGALLAYALVRAAFFFLQIQPPFAAGRSASGALSTEGAGGQGTGKDDTVFDGLDAVPWREVKHAYGPAVDAPKWIRLLDSEDSDLRAEAVYGFLLSSAFHQYTLYPATPFVILFAIQALQSQSLCARDVMDNSMRWHLLNFIEVCARCGQRSIFGSPHPKAPTIEDAVLSGADAYVLHANDTEPRTAEVARWLVEWCRARAT